jgi:hypothetical protein
VTTSHEFLAGRPFHASIQMTMRYAVYLPPMASTHYDRAISSPGIEARPAWAATYQAPRCASSSRHD